MSASQGPASPEEPTFFMAMASFALNLTSSEANLPYTFDLP